MSAVLLEARLSDAESALEELVELGLLQSPYVTRYRLHDLVRLFARERLTDEEPPQDRQAASNHMTEWLLDVATVAGRWFEPDYGQPPTDFDGLVSFGTREDAHAWLEIEGANWPAALRTAATDGRHARVVEVAGTMHWFSDRLKHWVEWHEVYELSRNAARAIGDRAAEAVHLNYLAWALENCVGRTKESVQCSLEAYELAREEGDLDQQAWALLTAQRQPYRIPETDSLTGAPSSCR